MASHVGIDLHRRRSVIVVVNEAGDRVWSSRIENSRLDLEVELRSIIDAVEGPVDVVIEATWGWYWAADVVEEVGVDELHLAHPLAPKVTVPGFSPAAGTRAELRGGPAVSTPGRPRRVRAWTRRSG